MAGVRPACCAPGSAAAVVNSEEPAKLAQNLVGNRLSVTVQNNSNLNDGPLSGTQNKLNIQPAIPFPLGPDDKPLTRAIRTLIWRPGFFPAHGSLIGCSAEQVFGFIPPSQRGPGGPLQGAGAIAQLSTGTNVLGNKNWALGPIVARMAGSSSHRAGS